MSYPSPSNRIAVSAITFKTKPTVVFSLQSMPKRHDSSPRFPILEMITKYLTRVGWTLSNLTAWNKKKFDSILISIRAKVVVNPAGTTCIPSTVLINLHVYRLIYLLIKWK